MSDKGNRCGRCGWALYDGHMCQNGNCLHGGTEPPTRVKMDTTEWCHWSAKKVEEGENLRESVRRLVGEWEALSKDPFIPELQQMALDGCAGQLSALINKDLTPPQTEGSGS